MHVYHVATQWKKQEREHLRLTEKHQQYGEKKKVPFFTLATEVSYHCKSVDFVDFKETSQWFLKGKR